MKIIDKLKEAISTKRWDIVLDVYEDLGGDVGSIVISEEPKKQKGRPKKIQEQSESKSSDNEFLSNIKGGSSSRREVTNKEIIIESDNTNLPKKKIIARAEPFDTKNRCNIFIDDGTEAIKDREFDRAVITKKPTLRNRPEYRLVEATCKKCRKKAMVDPLFQAHFRCQECSMIGSED